MKNTAILLSTTNGYAAQAAAMHRQLAAFGVAERAWLVPLEPLDAAAEATLRGLFPGRRTAVLDVPYGVKTSGNKPFLPTMVPPHDHYLLLDTDLVVLRAEFFAAFARGPDDAITLVADTFTVADYLGAAPSHAPRFAAFPGLDRRPYLQTGAIGLPRAAFVALREELYAGLRRAAAATTTGDLQAWNHLAAAHPERFRLLAPEACLVLRPDGGGFSTGIHRPDVRWRGGAPEHRGAPVLCLHYTHSGGAVRTLQDYADLYT
ncbi:MAG: hypothetical protein R3A79_15185 [Nannocystaceae bacterium]